MPVERLLHGTAAGCRPDGGGSKWNRPTVARRDSRFACPPLCPPSKFAFFTLPWPWHAEKSGFSCPPMAVGGSITSQNARSRRVQPFCRIKSPCHGRGRARNPVFYPSHGGRRVKRLAKTPVYAVAGHFVQSFCLDTAGTGSNDRPKRLFTPSPAVLSNRFA